MSKVIGVRIGSDEVEWHAVNGVAGADYDTLCGIDANDSVVGHHGTVPAPRGQKINCRQCFEVWRGVRDMCLRSSSFEV